MSALPAKNPVLSAREKERRAELEGRVLEGTTMVFDALVELKEGRLYRDTHATFEDYCRDVFSYSRVHVYRLINAAEVINDLRPSLLPMGNKPEADPAPISERQARPLTRLKEPEQRREAWDKAKEKAGDKAPTARQVEEAAEEVVPRPKTSRVNGVAAADPPDVAKARAAGRIAPDVVVEVTEPDAAPEPEPEPPPAEPAEEDLDDEAWLDSLPLASKLAGACLKWFRVDALLYRALEDARGRFLGSAQRALAVARRKGGGRGEYAFRLSAFLKLDHPKHWLLCPRPEDGGCGGQGTIGVIGECPKCHGRGYRIS